MDGTAAPLVEWRTFYEILGTAAASLTGLQFVVIALLAQARTRATGHEIAAFGSPTVAHFCGALFISGAVSAPWHSLRAASFPLAASGCIGALYAIIVARRAHRQSGYKPELTDWVWHVALPLTAYVALLAAGAALPLFTTASLFTTGAAALLLVYIGIHNAWDTVVYLAVTHFHRDD